MTMRIIDLLRAEHDLDTGRTRRMLEVVPLDEPDWRPHPKSMTIGRLAGHVAEIPQWGRIVLTTRSFDLAGGGMQPATATARGPLLELFDEASRGFGDALAGARDEALGEPWRLERGGQALFEVPRHAALRDFVFHHAVHHRAQLGVYLRLRDVPVPGIYGPSADERF